MPAVFFIEHDKRFHYHLPKYNESYNNEDKNAISSGIDKQINRKAYRTRQTPWGTRYITEVAFKSEGKEQIIQNQC